MKEGNKMTARDERICERLREHLEEAMLFFPTDRIVGIFVQGSQNYNLDYEKSDLDTKLIVVPTFEQIAMNRKPVSTTHVRANDEHIDFKDVRLYMDTFKKQNLNFLEILFTDFALVNPLYQAEWQKLVAAREQIAHMNPRRAVKSMKGIAMEKYHAMEKPYPSKVEIIKEWGYDCKQLHHLLRVEEYLGRYIDGESYKNCLIPRCPEYLIDVKRGRYDLETARSIAKTTIDNVTRMADEFCESAPESEDPEMTKLLEDVQYGIMKIAIKEELREE
jgi:hypothetical protein